ncbi:Hypothetical predicted protein [Octopus vulgaris]|uniref:Uncharacterized protein n=1 Tax=Octopus vulgaris TaxID=6645 RepID=A0AA36EYY4_OCTVU|nr:Hypothetical predicted protein [Octopus vulgaris]
MECLQPSTKKHRDWFDENCAEIKPLLEEKHRVYKAHLTDPKSVSKRDRLWIERSKIQTKLCQMQDSWLSSKADIIQGFADRNDMKNFYDSLKKVYGPTTLRTLSPLLSADRATLITDKEKVLERCAEHFDSVLNRPSTINGGDINRLPQVSVEESMDIEPTLEEIQKACCLLSSGKAPGPDSIPTPPSRSIGLLETDDVPQNLGTFYKQALQTSVT